MPTWWDRLVANKRWGKDSALDEPTDTEANAGFNFLGESPPTAGLHDALFQYKDDADYWIYQQIKAECDTQGITLNSAVYTALRDSIAARIAAVNTAISNEAATRANDDNFLNTAITTEATNRFNADSGEAIARSNGDAALQASKQDVLGFTPARQLGANLAYYGWDSSKLVGQIDSTFLGEIWNDNSTPRSLGANGYQKLSSGFMLQWVTNITVGNVQASDSGNQGTINWPVSFPNSCVAVFGQLEETLIGNIIVLIPMKNVTGCSWWVQEWKAATQDARLNLMAIGY